MSEKLESKKGGPKEMQVAWESAELIVELAELPITIVMNLLGGIFGVGEK